MTRARALVLSLAVALGCGHPDPVAEVAHDKASAVAVGAPAPDVQLTGVSGARVALGDVLHQHAQTVVVFYRGFW